MQLQEDAADLHLIQFSIIVSGRLITFLQFLCGVGLSVKTTLMKNIGPKNSASVTIMLKCCNFKAIMEEPRVNSIRHKLKIGERNKYKPKLFVSRVIRLKYKCKHSNHIRVQLYET